MNRLPVIKYKGKEWFFDERLREIRNINNPHDFIELNSKGEWWKDFKLSNYKLEKKGDEE